MITCGPWATEWTCPRFIDNILIQYIVVGSHLHNTSIQLHNVYFIFLLILSFQGVVFRPPFLNTSYSSPTHTLLFGPASPAHYQHYRCRSCALYVLVLLSCMSLWNCSAYCKPKTLERPPQRCNISWLFHSGCGPQVQEPKFVVAKE